MDNTTIEIDDKGNHAIIWISDKKTHEILHNITVTESTLTQKNKRWISLNIDLKEIA